MLFEITVKLKKIANGLYAICLWNFQIGTTSSPFWKCNFWGYSFKFNLIFVTVCYFLAYTMSNLQLSFPLWYQCCLEPSAFCLFCSRCLTLLLNSAWSRISWFWYKKLCITLTILSMKSPSNWFSFVVTLTDTMAFQIKRQASKEI